MDFERALEIDPSNIPSIVALAVLDLNTHEAEGIKRAIQALGMAYQSELNLIRFHLRYFYMYFNHINLIAENFIIVYTNKQSLICDLKLST